MIGVEARISGDELIANVRETTLLGSDVRPYQDATIEIKEVSLDEFRPLQLYVLRNNIRVQDGLRRSLAHLGHDPLQLDGGLTIRNGDHTVGLIPPIVEEDSEHGYCLVDGTHRTYLGRQLGLRSMTALCITDVPTEYPVYAFPNEWSEVVEYDAVPADKSLKKRYRPGNSDHLRRDLGFLNGSVRREAGSES